MTAEARKWPLDFDALAKGTTIPAEQLEEIFGLRRDDRRFRLKLLSLRDRVLDEMKRRGRIVTVKIEGETALRVLTDEEAASHNPRLFESGHRMMRRAYARNAGVDLNHLSEGQLRQHERNLIVQGKTLQAADTAKRSAAQLRPAERQTPGRLTGEE